jgi:hypothetical protein
MTNDPARRPGPAWTAHPGPEVTLTPATPGDVRTGRNGVQWFFDADHEWHPVVTSSPAPERQLQPEREAGA